MRSKGGDPRDAELGGRDAFPRRNALEGFGDGEVGLQVLWCGYVSVSSLSADITRRTDLLLELSEAEAEVALCKMVSQRRSNFARVLTRELVAGLEGVCRETLAEWPARMV